jgi:hypothetical protein
VGRLGFSLMLLLPWTHGITRDIRHCMLEVAVRKLMCT